MVEEVFAREPYQAEVICEGEARGLPVPEAAE